MTKVVFRIGSLAPKPFSTPWSYLTDKNDQPCRGNITQHDDMIVCTCPQQSFSLNALLEVPTFGRVVLRTNVIKPGTKKVNLIDAFVEGRINQIKIELQKENALIPVKLLREFQALTKRKNSQQKLVKLMVLGEKIVRAVAGKKLATKIASGEASSIKFGGQAFGIKRGKKYIKAHEEAFDLGVAPLYFFLLKGTSRGQTDWRLTDRVVAWLTRKGTVVRGHPLVWLHQYARPEWMRQLNVEQLKKFLTRHVTTIVQRYKDRIKIWDITNEFATADANGFDLTIDELMDIMKLVSDLVKKLQPQAHRIINLTDIWAAGSFVQDKPSIPPIHFLKMCHRKGIEYEGIGLQFYMGLKKDFTCRELLNISQTVDQFVQFDKPIHFSEMGFPSKHDVDPGSFFPTDHPEAGGWWHRQWDEKTQAEFLENLLTIFASKPKAKSIIWWDLTDNGTGQDVGSRFLTFSGLTRRDFSAKPAYHTWLKFKKRCATGFSQNTKWS